MDSRNYGYQYETSPRKIRQDYSKPRKKQTKKTTTVAKKKKPNQANIRKKQEEKKNQRKLISKTKFFVFVKCVLLFGILFLILFRNSQASEAFSKIQSLKAEMASIQKENDHLEISIQNSLNINHVEQKAKELLGMQKLTPKQTVYITLPKKDYVEPKTEEVIIDEEKSFMQIIFEKITNIF